MSSQSHLIDPNQTGGSTPSHTTAALSSSPYYDGAQFGSTTPTSALRCGNNGSMAAAAAAAAAAANEYPNYSSPGAGGPLFALEAKQRMLLNSCLKSAAADMNNPVWDQLYGERIGGFGGGGVGGSTPGSCSMDAFGSAEVEELMDRMAMRNVNSLIQSYGQNGTPEMPRSHSSAGFYYGTGGGASVGAVPQSDPMSAPNSVMSVHYSSASSPYGQQPHSIHSSTSSSSSSMTPPSVKSGGGGGGGGQNGGGQQQLQRPNQTSTPQLVTNPGSYPGGKFCDSIASSPVMSPMSGSLPLAPRCHSNSSAAAINSSPNTPYTPNGPHTPGGGTGPMTPGCPMTPQNGPLTPVGGPMTPGSGCSMTPQQNGPLTPNGPMTPGPMVPNGGNPRTPVHLKREDTASSCGSPFASNSSDYNNLFGGGGGKRFAPVGSPASSVVSLKRSPSVEPASPYSNRMGSLQSNITPSPASSLVNRNAASSPATAGPGTPYSHLGASAANYLNSANPGSNNSYMTPYHQSQYPSSVASASYGLDSSTYGSEADLEEMSIFEDAMEDGQIIEEHDELPRLYKPRFNANVHAPLYDMNLTHQHTALHAMEAMHNTLRMLEEKESDERQKESRKRRQLMADAEQRMQKMLTSSMGKGQLSSLCQFGPNSSSSSYSGGSNYETFGEDITTKSLMLSPSQQQQLSTQQSFSPLSSECKYPPPNVSLSNGVVSNQSSNPMMSPYGSSGTPTPTSLNASFNSYDLYSSSTPTNNSNHLSNNNNHGHHHNQSHQFQQQQSFSDSNSPSMVSGGVSNGMIPQSPSSVGSNINNNVPNTNFVLNQMHQQGSSDSSMTSPRPLGSGSSGNSNNAYTSMSSPSQLPTFSNSFKSMSASSSQLRSALRADYNELMTSSNKSHHHNHHYNNNNHHNHHHQLASHFPNGINDPMLSNLSPAVLAKASSGNAIESISFDPKTGMYKVKKKRGRPRKNPMAGPTPSRSSSFGSGGQKSPGAFSSGSVSSILSSASSSGPYGLSGNGLNSHKFINHDDQFGDDPFKPLSQDADPYAFPSFMDGPGPVSHTSHNVTSQQQPPAPAALTSSSSSTTAAASVSTPSLSSTSSTLSSSVSLTQSQSFVSSASLSSSTSSLSSLTTTSSSTISKKAHHHHQLHHQSSISSVNSLSEPPVKRPRGRPRIHDPSKPASTPRVKAPPANIPSIAQIIPSLPGQPVMKRGRGRPKSLKTLLKEAEAAVSLAKSKGEEVPEELQSFLEEGRKAMAATRTQQEKEVTLQQQYQMANMNRAAFASMVMSGGQPVSPPPPPRFSQQQQQQFQSHSLSQQPMTSLNDLLARSASSYQRNGPMPNSMYSNGNNGNKPMPLLASMAHNFAAANNNNNTNKSLSSGITRIRHLSDSSSSDSLDSSDSSDDDDDDDTTSTDMDQNEVRKAAPLKQSTASTNSTNSTTTTSSTIKLDPISTLTHLPPLKAPSSPGFPLPAPPSQLKKKVAQQLMEKGSGGAVPKLKPPKSERNNKANMNKKSISGGDKAELTSDTSEDESPYSMSSGDDDDDEDTSSTSNDDDDDGHDDEDDDGVNDLDDSISSFSSSSRSSARKNNQQPSSGHNHNHGSNGSGSKSGTTPPKGEGSNSSNKSSNAAASITSKSCSSLGSGLISGRRNSKSSVPVGPYHHRPLPRTRQRYGMSGKPKNFLHSNFEVEDDDDEDDEDDDEEVEDDDEDEEEEEQPSDKKRKRDNKKVPKGSSGQRVKEPPLPPLPKLVLKLNQNTPTPPPPPNYYGGAELSSSSNNASGIEGISGATSNIANSSANDDNAFTYQIKRVHNSSRTIDGSVTEDTACSYASHCTAQSATTAMPNTSCTNAENRNNNNNNNNYPSDNTLYNQDQESYAQQYASSSSSAITPASCYYSSTSTLLPPPQLPSTQNPSLKIRIKMTKTETSSFVCSQVNNINNNDNTCTAVQQSNQQQPSPPLLPSPEQKNPSPVQDECSISNENDDRVVRDLVSYLCDLAAIQVLQEEDNNRTAENGSESETDLVLLHCQQDTNRAALQELMSKIEHVPISEEDSAVRNLIEFNDNLGATHQFRTPPSMMTSHHHNHHHAHHNNNANNLHSLQSPSHNYYQNGSSSSLAFEVSSDEQSSAINSIIGDLTGHGNSMDLFPATPQPPRDICVVDSEHETRFLQPPEVGKFAEEMAEANLAASSLLMEQQQQEQELQQQQQQQAEVLTTTIEQVMEHEQDLMMPNDQQNDDFLNQIMNCNQQPFTTVNNNINNFVEEEELRKNLELGVVQHQQHQHQQQPLLPQPVPLPPMVPQMIQQQQQPQQMFQQLPQQIMIPQQQQNVIHQQPRRSDTSATDLALLDDLISTEENFNTTTVVDSLFVDSANLDGQYNGPQNSLAQLTQFANGMHPHLTSELDELKQFTSQFGVNNNAQSSVLSSAHQSSHQLISVAPQSSHLMRPEMNNNKNGSINFHQVSSFQQPLQQQQQQTFYSHGVQQQQQQTFRPFPVQPQPSPQGFIRPGVGSGGGLYDPLALIQQQQHQQNLQQNHHQQQQQLHNIFNDQNRTFGSTGNFIISGVRLLDSQQQQQRLQHSHQHQQPGILPQQPTPQSPGIFPGFGSVQPHGIRPAILVHQNSSIHHQLNNNSSATFTPIQQPTQLNSTPLQQYQQQLLQQQQRQRDQTREGTGLSMNDSNRQIMNNHLLGSGPPLHQASLQLGASSGLNLAHLGQQQGPQTILSNYIRNPMAERHRNAPSFIQVTHPPPSFQSSLGLNSPNTPTPGAAFLNRSPPAIRPVQPSKSNPTPNLSQLLASINPTTPPPPAIVPMPLPKPFPEMPVPLPLVPPVSSSPPTTINYNNHNNNNTKKIILEAKQPTMIRDKLDAKLSRNFPGMNTETLSDLLGKPNIMNRCGTAASLKDILAETMDEDDDEFCVQPQQQQQQNLFNPNQFQEYSKFNESNESQSLMQMMNSQSMQQHQQASSFPPISNNSNNIDNIANIINNNTTNNETFEQSDFDDIFSDAFATDEANLEEEIRQLQELESWSTVVDTDGGDNCGLIVPSMNMQNNNTTSADQLVMSLVESSLMSTLVQPQQQQPTMQQPIPTTFQQQPNQPQQIIMNQHQTQPKPIEVISLDDDEDNINDNVNININSNVNTDNIAIFNNDIINGNENNESGTNLHQLLHDMVHKVEVESELSRKVAELQTLRQRRRRSIEQQQQNQQQQSHLHLPELRDIQQPIMMAQVVEHQTTVSDGDKSQSISNLVDWMVDKVEGQSDTIESIEEQQPPQSQPKPATDNNSNSDLLEQSLPADKQICVELLNNIVELAAQSEPPKPVPTLPPVEKESWNFSTTLYPTLDDKMSTSSILDQIKLDDKQSDEEVSRLFGENHNSAAAVASKRRRSFEVYVNLTDLTNKRVRSNSLKGIGINSPIDYSKVIITESRSSPVSRVASPDRSTISPMISTTESLTNRIESPSSVARKRRNSTSTHDGECCCCHKSSAKVAKITTKIELPSNYRRIVDYDDVEDDEDEMMETEKTQTETTPPAMNHVSFRTRSRSLVIRNSNTSETATTNESDIILDFAQFCKQTKTTQPKRKSIPLETTTSTSSLLKDTEELLSKHEVASTTTQQEQHQEPESSVQHPDISSSVEDHVNHDKKRFVCRKCCCHVEEEEVDEVVEEEDVSKCPAHHCHHHCHHRHSTSTGTTTTTTSSAYTSTNESHSVCVKTTSGNSTTTGTTSVQPALPPPVTIRHDPNTGIPTVSINNNFNNTEIVVSHAAEHATTIIHINSAAAGTTTKAATSDNSNSIDN